jgi:hypothetical protein
MKGIAIVCTLIALGSPALYAQNRAQQEQQITQQSAQNVQQNMERMAQQTDARMVQGDHQAWLNSMPNLTKLRSKLAEAWQTLGMSPPAAHAVASAYMPNLAVNLHHAPLRGKSDEEIAAMLQSALAKKDYLMADQLLIDHQREQLLLGEATSTSPEGRR